MKTPLSRTPLELPRQALYQKHYSAVLCGDGSILPIEERLGRRLLRTIDPTCREGRDLLRRGWVALRTLDGKSIERTPVLRVYARLREEAEARLAERPEDAPWCQHYRSMLASIERWERSLEPGAREH